MNFGGYGTPERQLAFDLNDFDETHPGPWEWDLKRLVASLNVAARHLGFTAAQGDEAVAAAVTSYQQHTTPVFPDGRPEPVADPDHARLGACGQRQRGRPRAGGQGHDEGAAALARTAAAQDGHQGRRALDLARCAARAVPYPWRQHAVLVRGRLDAPGPLDRAHRPSLQRLSHPRQARRSRLAGPVPHAGSGLQGGGCGQRGHALPGAAAHRRHRRADDAADQAGPTPRCWLPTCRERPPTSSTRANASSRASG
jgi:hypothetical protein